MFFDRYRKSGVEDGSSRLSNFTRPYWLFPTLLLSLALGACSSGQAEYLKCLNDGRGFDECGNLNTERVSDSQQPGSVQRTGEIQTSSYEADISLYDGLDPHVFLAAIAMAESSGGTHTNHRVLEDESRAWGYFGMMTYSIRGVSVDEFLDNPSTQYTQTLRMLREKVAIARYFGYKGDPVVIGALWLGNCDVVEPIGFDIDSCDDGKTTPRAHGEKITGYYRRFINNPYLIDQEAPIIANFFREARGEAARVDTDTSEVQPEPATGTQASVNVDTTVRPVWQGTQQTETHTPTPQPAPQASLNIQVQGELIFRGKVPHGIHGCAHQAGASGAASYRLVNGICEVYK
jgi:hypothetical protein